MSNWAAWQIVKALGISDKHGLARFESLQAYYTVAGRDLEREIVPMLRSEVLQAQSANVDLIGGATMTSEAYDQSLQVAVDQAHGAHTL